MHVSDVRELLTHMEWADTTVWQAVLAYPEAAANPEIRARLYHVHAVQHVYLQLWRGQRPQPPALESFDSVEALHDWACTFYPAALEWAAALTDVDLHGMMAFPWGDDLLKHFGVARPATVGETVLQVAMHSAQHRGQTLMQLRQLGKEPPLTDFIAWIWSGKP